MDNANTLDLELLNNPLSATQLRAINHHIQQNFAPHIVQHGIDMRLCAQELRDISLLITREFLASSPEYATQVVLLPVDPQQLYVYWRFDATQIALNNTIDDAINQAEALTLRVYVQPYALEMTEDTLRWFDTALPKQCSGIQAINLPPEALQSNTTLSYSAVIGFQTGRTLLPIAHANEAYVPARFNIPTCLMSSTRGCDKQAN